MKVLCGIVSLSLLLWVDVVSSVNFDGDNGRLRAREYSNTTSCETTKAAVTEMSFASVTARAVDAGTPSISQSGNGNQTDQAGTSSPIHLVEGTEAATATLTSALPAPTHLIEGTEAATAILPVEQTVSEVTTGGTGSGSTITILPQPPTDTSYSIITTSISGSLMIAYSPIHLTQAISAAGFDPATVGAAPTPITTPAAATYVIGAQPIVVGQSPGNGDSGIHFVQASPAAGSDVNQASQTITQTTTRDDGQVVPVTTVVPVEKSSQRLPVLVVGGSSYTANPASQYDLGNGQILAPDGSTMTISGTPIALLPGASSAVIAGVTSAITQAAPGLPVALPPLTLGSSVIAPSGDHYALPDGQTLSVGGPTMTVGGTAVAVASGGSGVVVGSSTYSANPVQTAPYIVAAGQVITADLAGAYVIGGSTLLVGGSSVTMGSQVYALQTNSAGQTEVVVGGTGVTETVSKSSSSTIDKSGGGSITGSAGTLGAVSKTAAAATSTSKSSASGGVVLRGTLLPALSFLCWLYFML